MFNGKDWVNSRFPESLYPSISDDYFDRVACGIDKMKRLDITICGIGKNIESNVQNILAKIYRLGSMFRSYNICIYENDSDDRTLSRLVETSARLNMPLTLKHENLKVEPHKQDKSEYRRERMAYARNKYLEFVKESSQDYFIVSDLDIITGWSYEGIAHSFSFDYDVVGSNGLVYEKDENGNFCRLFYDTWAYRTLDDEELPQEECNLLNFKRGSDLHNVGSCFGGLCIYKREALDDDMCYTKDDCDHVTLHRQMREKGKKIYLNPSQIVVYS